MHTEQWNLCIKVEDRSPRPLRPLYIQNNHFMKDGQYNEAECPTFHHIISASRIIEVWDKAIQNPKHLLALHPFLKAIKDNYHEASKYVKEHNITLSDKSEKLIINSTDSERVQKYIQHITDGTIVHNDDKLIKRHDAYDDFVQILAWQPFNLVVGPESHQRECDPGAKFDEEAANLLPNEQRERLKSANEHLNNYLQRVKSRKKSTTTELKSLESFSKIMVEACEASNEVQNTARNKWKIKGTQQDSNIASQRGQVDNANSNGHVVHTQEAVQTKREEVSNQPAEHTNSRSVGKIFEEVLTATSNEVTITTTIQPKTTPVENGQQQRTGSSSESENYGFTDLFAVDSTTKSNEIITIQPKAIPAESDKDVYQPANPPVKNDQGIYQPAEPAINIKRANSSPKSGNKDDIPPKSGMSHREILEKSRIITKEGIITKKGIARTRGITT